jgi:MFS family permease
MSHPSWRASAVGVYRLWRDLGYAVGALLAGVTADAFGVRAAMWLVAVLTFCSGVVSAARMRETLPVLEHRRSNNGARTGSLTGFAGSTHRFPTDGGTQS